MATISSLLADHVTLQVRSVDRLFLQGYVPRLMSEGLVVRFLLDRGFSIPSPSLLGDISRGYVAAVERFASEHQLEVIRFERRESKEDRVRPYLMPLSIRPLRRRRGRGRAGEGVGLAWQAGGKLG